VTQFAVFAFVFSGVLYLLQLNVANIIMHFEHFGYCEPLQTCPWPHATGFFQIHVHLSEDTTTATT